MKCSEWQKEIVPFLLDDMAADAKAAFVQHCAECPSCMGRLGEMRRTFSLIDAAKSPAAPVELWPQVRGRLTARPAGWRTAVMVPAASLLIAAAVVLPVMRMHRTAVPGEMEIVKNIDMLTDYDICENLEMLEGMDSSS